jgi:DNA-binding PadR family transcriptional regulator
MRQQSRHLPAFLLLLLAEHPMHGGAIQSELKRAVPSLKADSGAVYRSLRKLEEDGEIVSQWETGNPGPALRIYSITAAGWKKLDFWREDIEHRIRNLRVFLARHKQVLRRSEEAQRRRESAE